MRTCYFMPKLFFSKLIFCFLPFIFLSARKTNQKELSAEPVSLKMFVSNLNRKNALRLNGFRFLRFSTPFFNARQPRRKFAHAVGIRMWQYVENILVRVGIKFYKKINPKIPPIIPMYDKIGKKILCIFLVHTINFQQTII